MHDSPSQRHAPDFGGGTILDARTVATLRELGGEEDPELFEELVELFLEDAIERVHSLTAAWERGEVESVALSAHALRSASASIGALSFSGSCRELEAEARTDGGQDLGPSVERCSGMFNEVQAVLEQMRGRT